MFRTGLTCVDTKKLNRGTRNVSSVIDVCEVQQLQRVNGLHTEVSSLLNQWLKLLNFHFRNEFHTNRISPHLQFTCRMSPTAGSFLVKEVYFNLSLYRVLLI